MGWIYTSAFRGGSIKDYLDRKFTGENETHRFRVLKSALVRMRAYYAAQEIVEKASGARRVIAIVVKVDYRPRDPEGMTLGYKSMDEGMGPNEVDCPLAILDLLTAPDPERYGAAWRERVRAYHARKTRRPKPGEILVFEQPIRFSDGSSGVRFHCERYRKRALVYRNLDTGTLCRIEGVMSLDYEIEKPSTVPAGAHDRPEPRRLI
jgi:hypothetical protein